MHLNINIFKLFTVVYLVILTNMPIANAGADQNASINTNHKTLQPEVTNSKIQQKLQDGDLIFHTSQSHQSQAVMFATQSPLSHVGLILMKNQDLFVLEAINKVSLTPLDKWIKRGENGKYVVYRYKNITQEQQKKVVENAQLFLNFPYDFYFNLDDQRIYCSELAYKAYAKTQIKLGTLQKVKDLDLKNVKVQNLIKGRAQQHPLCLNKRFVIDRCIEVILDDEIMTPAQLAKDKNLIKIVDTY